MSESARPSRLPLSTANTLNRVRTPSTTQETARKLKRRSITAVNGPASKQARPLSSSSSRPSIPSSASRVPSSRPVGSVTRPLSSSYQQGRATTVGIPRSNSRVGLPPIPSIRQRTSSTSERNVLETENQQLKEELQKIKAENAAKQLEWTMKESNLMTEKMQVQSQLMQLETLKMQTDRALQMEKDNLQLQTARHEEELRNRDKTIEEVSNALASLKREVIVKDDYVRTLHNNVVDLKGQIRVAIRVRPPSNDEDGNPDHLSYPNEYTIGLETTKGKIVPFEFHSVYGPNYSQSRIFENVQELIVSSLHGYNVAIIAFGQTGSGKTYTMRGGDGERAGLIPRAVDFLFDSRHKLEDLDWKFTFCASFYEVYNDECYDLLSTPPRAKCDVNIGSGKTCIPGLTTVDINTKESMTKLLMTSDRNRSTASTKCNATSSRSHAIFALRIVGINATTGAKVESELKMVDLAGSERVKESGVEGKQFTEMTHINTALSNLQNVLRALLNKQSHIPYRSSRLTMLLQDSLGGGNSKSMVIVSLSPQLTNIVETKRSLEFARDMGKTHIGAAKKRET